MTKRGLGVVTVLLLAAGGCVPGASTAQRVELIAGGGEGNGGPAADALIDGQLIDMTVDRAGTLRMLTAKQSVATMWTVQGGILSRVAVPDLKPEYVSQMTAGPDGAVYVALWNGEGGVWQISPEGRATHRIGIDRATYRGDRLPPADGDPVNGAYLQYMHGVAVGPDNRMYFAEQRIRPTTHQLVRTVDGGGNLKTVLGRDLLGLTARDWRSARTREGGFPDGSPATGIALEGGLNNLLAIGADGTLFAGPGRRSVVAVGPDGAARELIGNVRARSRDEIDEAEEPFAERGKATQASVWLKGTRGAGRGQANASLVTDTAGNVYVTSVRPGRDKLPEEFDWTGDATGRRLDLLEQSREDRRQRSETSEVLQIRPDGTLTTAAGHADSAAVQGDWLYLARAFTDEDNEARVIVVRTAIPR